MYGHQFSEVFSIDFCKKGNLCDPSTQFGYPSLLLMDRFVLGVAKMIQKYFLKTAQIYLR